MFWTFVSLAADIIKWDAIGCDGDQAGRIV